MNEKLVSKFPVSLTEAAKKRMFEMIMRVKESRNDVIGISLSVKKGRCAAWEYKFNYVSFTSHMDITQSFTTGDQDFVFVVDPLALMAVSGAEIDYIGDDIKSGFVFNNPNAKGSCGCGESFDV